MAQAEVKPPRYSVTGACVLVKTGALAGIIPGRGGYAAVTLYRGALIPEDAPAEQVEHLLTSELIERIG